MPNDEVGFEIGFAIGLEGQRGDGANTLHRFGGDGHRLFFAFRRKQRRRSFITTATAAALQQRKLQEGAESQEGKREEHDQRQFPAVDEGDDEGKDEVAESLDEASDPNARHALDQRTVGGERRR